MREYKKIAVVGRGAVGLSILDQLSQLKKINALTYDTLYSYDSKTIVNSYKTKPDLLIYAGVPGVKWKANQNKDLDDVQIEQAFSNIKQIDAKMTILISTIDAGYNLTEENVYGRNRLELEKRVLDEIDNSRVVRLPALKGKYITKNFWFDSKYPRLINVSESMFSRLSESIDIIGLDYDIVKISDTEYSVIEKDTQLEVSSTEFGKYMSTNPYSQFLWLDVDNFVFYMLKHIEVSDDKVFTLASLVDGLIAYLKAYEVYQLTTGRHMKKSIRSEYKNRLQKVDYVKADTVRLVVCDEIKFDD